MAIAAVPTEVIVNFKDRENTATKTRFYLPVPGVLNVNAQAIYTKARTMALAVAACSDCQMTGFAVLYQDRDNAAAGAGEAERKGNFMFAVNGGTNYTTQVPGFLDSLLDANKRTIAVAGPDVAPEVQAFIDALLDGPPSFNNGATNASGLSLVRAVDGRKTHVRSLVERRGRSG